MATHDSRRATRRHGYDNHYNDNNIINGKENNSSSNNNGNSTVGVFASRSGRLVRPTISSGNGSYYSPQKNGNTPQRDSYYKRGSRKGNRIRYESEEEEQQVEEDEDEAIVQPEVESSDVRSNNPFSPYKNSERSRSLRRSSTNELLDGLPPVIRRRRNSRSPTSIEGREDSNNNGESSTRNGDNHDTLSSQLNPPPTLHEQTDQVPLPSVDLVATSMPIATSSSPIGLARLLTLKFEGVTAYTTVIHLSPNLFVNNGRLKKPPPRHSSRLAQLSVDLSDEEEDDENIPLNQRRSLIHSQEHVQEQDQEQVQEGELQQGGDVRYLRRSSRSHHITDNEMNGGRESVATTSVESDGEVDENGVRRYPKRIHHASKRFIDEQGDEHQKQRNNRGGHRSDDSEFELEEEEEDQEDEEDDEEELETGFEENGLHISSTSARYALRRRKASYANLHSGGDGRFDSHRRNESSASPEEFHSGRDEYLRRSQRQRTEVHRYDPFSAEKRAQESKQQQSQTAGINGTTDAIPYHGENNGMIRTRSANGRGAVIRADTRRKGKRHRRHSHGHSNLSRNDRMVGLNDSNSSHGSSSDSTDEEFYKKEEKRLKRERNQILPINMIDPLSLSSFTNRGKGGMPNDSNKHGALADVDPITVTTPIDWNSIGGLEAHIRALKEMVVLPMLYPELFDRFSLTPPRGVLFFGPPGTGKTLVARALASTCSSHGKRVAFFMRKGADCLSKWVGEAERQLRLLFEQATKQQPSIIFFDELDGLAPVRSSKQDQIHSSIVSTLLALMDGLDSRGSVIVIGATNRIDAIDPALRRPGRFDRELCFALPSKTARASILSIHTKHWSPPLSPEFLSLVATKCVGYCGADLRALCTEAALRAIRRTYPQIYASTQKLVVEPQTIRPRKGDFFDAMRSLVPAAQRSSVNYARLLNGPITPLLTETEKECQEKVKKFFPLAAINKSSLANGDGEQNHIDWNLEEEEDQKKKQEDDMKDTSSTALASPLSSSLSDPPLPFRPRFLLHAPDSGYGQSHLAPALLYAFEEYSLYSIDLPSLLSDSISRSIEESCIRIILESKRQSPTVLYWPHIDSWWESVSENLRIVIVQLLEEMTVDEPILLIATADRLFETLPSPLQKLFHPSVAIQHQLKLPSAEARRNFFQQLVIDVTRKPPLSSLIQHSVISPPPLPIAAPSPPPPPVEEDESLLSVAEFQYLLESEDSILRSLRMFLRGVMTALLKQFKEFGESYSAGSLNSSDDPGTSEAREREYREIIIQPIGLFDIQSKVNAGAYLSIPQFLSDFDLLVMNTKEYWSARSQIMLAAATIGSTSAALSAGRTQCNRVCHLQDVALSYAGQLDEKVRRECVEIAERRAKRKSLPESHPHALLLVKSRSTNNNKTNNKHSKVEEDEAGRRVSARLRGAVPLLLPECKAIQSPNQFNESEQGHQEKQEVKIQDDNPQHTLSQTSQYSFQEQNESRENLPMEIEGEQTSREADPGNEMQPGTILQEEEPVGLSIAASTEIEEQKLEEEKQTSDTTPMESVMDGSFNSINASSPKTQNNNKEEINQTQPNITPPSNQNGQLDTSSAAPSTETIAAPSLPTPPPFLLDSTRMTSLISSLIDITSYYNVSELEMLHFHLYRIMHRHVSEWDRTAMLQEMEEMVQEHARRNERRES